jgi:hypothetical protein
MNRTLIEPGIIVVGNTLQHSQSGYYAGFKFGMIDSLEKAVSYCGMPKRIVKKVILAFPEYNWS